MTDTHTVTDGLSATVAADGAELIRLRDRDGTDLLWDAGPLWPSHSPVLFPIIGQLAGDQLRSGGRTFPMGRHGFARRRRFDWIERGPDACRLQLRDDPETAAVFPFPFRLDLTYRVDAGALHVGYVLENPGVAPLPASLGAHPAFRWPLRGGAQTEHRIEFAEPEPGPIHRLSAGLLDPAPQPTPIEDRTLRLDPALFEADAMILLDPRSRALRYVGPGGALLFEWEGFPQLGLWQKPGADFVCIEPWHGYSSPVGWDGDFADKPGVMLIAPGEARHFSWSVRPL